MKRKISLFIFVLFLLNCTDNKVEDLTSEATKDFEYDMLNDGLLAFTYNDTLYSSHLKNDNSDIFFEDSIVEGVYKKILGNSNAVIHVVNPRFWNIYDNQEEYSKNVKSTPSTKSLYMEPRAYDSNAYLYENDNLKGKYYNWQARRDMVYGAFTYSFHLNNYDLQSKVSSFIVANTSHNHNISFNLLTYNGKRELYLDIDPENALVIPSITKAFGKDKNDAAEYGSFSFYTKVPLKNPDAYVLEYVIYNTIPGQTISKKQVQISGGYISNYNSLGATIEHVMFGDAKDEVTFIIPSGTPTIDYSEPNIIGIPQIINGSIDLVNLKENVWNYKVNTKQENTRRVSSRINIYLSGYKTEKVRLMCNEYSFKVQYKAGFISMKSGRRLEFKGLLEAKIQDEPCIWVGQIVRPSL